MSPRRIPDNTIVEVHDTLCPELVPLVEAHRVEYPHPDADPRCAVVVFDDAPDVREHLVYCQGCDRVPASGGAL